MKMNKVTTMITACFFVFCLSPFLPTPVSAQDVQQLAKDASSALRQSERLMFDGKLDEAVQQLQNAANLIEQLTAADPNFSQLKSLQSKYDKQKRDLDKRRPKEEQPAESKPTGQPEPAATEKPSEPEPTKESEPTDAAPEGADLAALAKQADTAIKNSQRAMFNGKLDDAKTQLDTAAALIAQIKAADSNFHQLQSLESAFAKQSTDLRKRLPETPPEKVARLLADPAETLAAAAEYLADENAPQDAVNEAERLFGDAVKRINDILQEAGDQVAPDQPEIQAIQQQAAAVQQVLDARKAGLADKAGEAVSQQAAKDTLSDAWLQKLNVYLLQGPKELIGSGTANVDELLSRKALYEEAKPLFDAYQRVEFPLGKTVELEMAEQELAYRLTGFEEGYQQTVESFAEAASQKLAQAEAWLTEQEANIAADPTLHTPYLHRDVIQGIQNDIFALDAATFGFDDRISGFNARLATITERGQALRQRGVELTVMRPDVFQGAEADAIKTKAAEFLNKEDSDAAALRTTIIDEDWKHEEGWEYTDTTKSTLRYRITRGVTVQIAAKRGSDVLLYSLYVAQDKQSDDSWGSLYGHVMYSDPMLAENVLK